MKTKQTVIWMVSRTFGRVHWLMILGFATFATACLPAGSSGSGATRSTNRGGSPVAAPVDDVGGQSAEPAAAGQPAMDTDGDGVTDDDDAFPNDDSESADSDGDGVGDNADVFPNRADESADEDGDGIGDNEDAFPTDANESSDQDGDGVGDNTDNCPMTSNADQADRDFDGLGDECDDEESLGVGSFQAFDIRFDLADRYEYTMTVSINAFDKEGQSVEVTDFVRAADQEDGAEYTVMGVTCDRAAPFRNYDAFLLFDRGGRMSGVDPMDEAPGAARGFIDNLGGSDRAFVAEFGSSNGPDYIEISDGFSSDKSRLRRDLGRLGRPTGGSSLWRSMSAALDRIAETSALGQRRALVAFSGGTDSIGEVYPAEIVDSALEKDTRIHAINLTDTDSADADRIALETGGTVFSTSDVARLFDYFSVLGQLLSGDAITCDLKIRAQSPPAVEGRQRKAFGPGGKPRKIPFGFRTDNAGTVVVELQSSMALGNIQGRNTNGSVIYQSDLSTAAPEVTDMIAQTDGYFVVCLEDDLGLCAEGFARAGSPLPRPIPDANRFRFAGCASIGEFIFRPALQTEMNESDGSRTFEYRAINNVIESESRGSVCVYEDALAADAD
ncbi:MAG: hypothetical protein VX589_09780 [Myxococcota bacterium]|nr:hypothetical protein [Myxococcota bacterium]